MPNLAATIQLKKLEAKFTLLGIKEKIFFDKPLSLKALNSAIVAALRAFGESLASKLMGLIDFDLDDLSELKNFIKSDPELSVLFSNANSELDNEILSSLLLQCEILNDSTITDETLKQQALDKLQNVNFLGDSLDKLADFLGDLTNKLAALGDALGPYLGIALFLYYIIKLAIDLILSAVAESTFLVPLSLPDSVFSNLVFNILFISFKTFLLFSIVINFSISSNMFSILFPFNSAGDTC